MRTAKIDGIEVQTTVMAIREELMNYFKGTCVERVTTDRNIRTVGLGATRGYYYLRRQTENESPRLLLIGDVPIATLRLSPDRVTFHRGSLSRSKQLREVYALLEEFMHDYLAGVGKEYNDANVFYK